MSTISKTIKILLIILFFSSCSGFSSPYSFKEAKKIARSLFNEHHRITLYCHCQYNQLQEINLDSCNMRTAASYKRAHRIEWEHMMPAEHFGRHFHCWHEPLCQKKGKSYNGRKCCEKVDAGFRGAEAELYNLWPSVGIINQARSNYQYSLLDTKNGYLGCDIEINATLHKIQPPDRAKGIVARANLFMAEHYHIQLSSAQKQLFDTWNKQFPPDAWEKNWASQIARIQGYSNPYIQ